MVDPGFWRNKRVFLTGHSGFKGAWLSLWLQQMGARVTGFALPPATTPSLYDLAGLGRYVDSHFGDIRDAEVVRKALTGSESEVVIHMAAQPLVRYSYANPIETYHTNVLGTVHVLDAVRFAPAVRAVLVVSSDKCYENREWVWGYRETDPMGGYDPYSSSKGCTELVTAAYRSSYFSPDQYPKHRVAVGSARAGNVIGGGDWSDDRLIPDLLRAIAAREPVRIRAPGAVRPWQHVMEPLSGYLALAQRLYSEGPKFGEGWNFGPDTSDARTVAWVMDYFARQWGGDAAWIREEGAQVHEANLLTLDCAKARQRLGYRSRWSLETAIDRIVSWHKELAPAGDSTVVFRDSAFADDVAKTNMAAILAQNGLENVRSL